MEIQRMDIRHMTTKKKSMCALVCRLIESQKGWIQFWEMQVWRKLFKTVHT